MPDALLYTNAYIKVEHLTPDTGNSSKEGYVNDLGLAAVPVNIQPTSPQMIALNGGAYGKAYTLFTKTTYSGILETDRLTTVSGTTVKTFIVKGRQLFDYGLAQHLELYVEEPQ